jgi:gliding motility-associated-like protein
MALKVSLLMHSSKIKIFNCKTLYSLLLYFFLFIISPAYAQLQDFQLEVTATNETCSGNGTLSFAITNGAQGATISYTVYKLPDLSNPISISSSNSVGSLAEGTYKVIATQSLGQSSNSQETDVTIIKVEAPFAFKLSGANQTCVDGAKLIVNVTEGTALQYEIISGPVVRPLQESNVFDNMPAGTYVVRVYNECGDAEVKTFTLSAGNLPALISDPVYESNTTGDCDTVTVTNTITFGEDVTISYPVTIEYVLTPSNGNPPTIITRTFESGDPIELSVTQTFPTDDSEYTYSIKITDNCNYSYSRDGMTLNTVLSISYVANVILPCGGHYLTLNVINFAPPYSLNFITAPEGFDATTYNGTYPGPFTEGGSDYGDKEMPVPEGDYEVEVTDNCGKTTTLEFTIADEIVEPAAGGSNNGCFSEYGRITVVVPDRKIVSAIIEQAPGAYTATHILPENVSNKINSSGLVILTDMPIGHYVIRIVDECGKEYIVEADVPPFDPQGFSAWAMSGCVVGSGAIRATSGNGKLTGFTITDAPEEFEEILPFVVSSHIDANGVFFMEGLPVGEYTFSGVDICGIEGTVTISVVPNSPPGNALNYVRKCGNYDLSLADSDTSTFADPPTYWLQKLIDVQNNVWGHPTTGAVFTEGTEPTAANSTLMINGQTLTDLENEGVFRVIKYFKSYISPENIQACFGTLGSFEYFDGVEIKSFYNISCYQNANDIYVDATGLAPLHYTIISKDDAPFFLDNGNNNIFSNLDPGTYTFFVEDACGDVKTGRADIRQLPELTNAHNPGDMLVCVEPNGSASAEFDLLSQNQSILDDQPASIYTISYHATAEDAENGVNAIPTLHTNISNPETLYARLVHNHITLCHDVVSFDLRVSEYPVLKLKQDYILCIDENRKTLYADPGYSSYQWSTGETTSSITVKESGNYWVKVGNQYDGIVCETTADITVALSGPPESWSVDTDDWTDNDNSISISATGPGNYEYSLDNENYQDSPFFDHLKTGVYTLYIRDKNGCGMVTEEIVLLNYPKFFTPNGDGINEKWHLEYSWFEPEALIYVYDRYGKLIISFTPKNPGWDGTYNGRQLPSTDYWFVVERKDGRVHKGHFSMIR